MLRLIKRHLKACSKTSETDFDCLAKVAVGLSKAEQKRTPDPRCPFYIVGPDPRPNRRGKVFKRNTNTSDQRLAVVQLADAERTLLLEPEKATRKPARKLEEVIGAFQATKRSVSKSLSR